MSSRNRYSLINFMVKHYWLLCVVFVGVSCIFGKQAITITDVSSSNESIHNTNNLDDQKTFQYGFNLYLNKQVYTSETDLTHKLQNLIYRIKDTQTNTIILTWPIYTHNNYSSYVFTDIGTPTKQEITIVTRLLSQAGYNIIYKPILDEGNITTKTNPNYWRGTIEPQDVDNWFLHYSDLIIQYTKLAEANKVRGFVIGTELVSLEAKPHWVNLIEDVKNVFSGYLTYASNRSISDRFPWDQLHYIGIDAFFEIPRSTEVSVEALTKYLQQNWVTPIVDKARHLNKPILVLEVGTRSENYSFTAPWGWNHNTGVNLEHQAIYYQAVCNTWGREPDMVFGIFWWALKLEQHVTPETDPSFNPLGKPAEVIIMNCLV